MRILQIVHSLPFLNQAGTEIYSYNLSLELSKRNEVFIFSRDCNLRQEEYEITKDIRDGVTIYLINNTFKECNSFEMYYENEIIDRKFAELLDKIRPDIAHIQHLVFLSTGLVREINRRNIPIVFTLHDYWLMCPRWHLLRKNHQPCVKPISGEFDQECLDCLAETLYIKRGIKKAYILTKWLFPAFLIKYLKGIYTFKMRILSDDMDNISKLKERHSKVRSILDKVDLFLSPSKYLRDAFVDFGIPLDKIKISDYGFPDIQPIVSKLPKTEKLRFAFIGTLLPAKGVHILVNAFNKITTENAELKIYGRLYSYIGFEDYLPYLKKLIRNNRVKFMGEFNHSDVGKIFSEIDVLIVPSIWYENMPLIIREAFLFKVPVIASSIGGIPEIIRHGLDGLLFNPGSIEELREKIEFVIDNPNIIKEFRENMPEIKSMEDNVKEMEEVYTDLI